MTDSPIFKHYTCTRCTCPECIRRDEVAAYEEDARRNVIKSRGVAHQEWCREIYEGFDQNINMVPEPPPVRIESRCAPCFGFLLIGSVALSIIGLAYLMVSSG